MGLALIEHKSINSLDQSQQILKRNVQPKVHRIGDDEFRSLHLIENMRLQGGGYVGQQHKWRFFVNIWQVRRKRFKNPQFGQERLAVIHVHFVFTGPMESFPRLDLQPTQINFMLSVEGKIRFWKVITHHANKFHWSEETRGHGRVAGGTAKELRVLSV